jgi:hypothetical protein
MNRVCLKSITSPFSYSKEWLLKDPIDSACDMHAFLDFCTIQLDPTIVLYFKFSDNLDLPLSISSSLKSMAPVCRQKTDTITDVSVIYHNPGDAIKMEQVLHAI